jgi:tetraacyldisaccharide 4'-kinase
MFRWTFVFAPLAIIYGIITYVRNLLFDFNLIKSYKIPIKSIVVGNLSVGGTGKTPHVFYISNLLSKQFKTSILSRGYGRKTAGYLDVFEESLANQVGDEPLLLKNRLIKNNVAVCESREIGVKQLIDKFAPDVIVLDDALQHRKVKAGLNILLTEFNRPFFSDFVMPMGRLREFTSGKKRADLVVVTKCPEVISLNKKEEFINKIGVNSSRIFFSKIVYAPLQSFSITRIESFESILLVSAIADDSQIVEYLSKSFSVKTSKFRDHHTFTKEDITKIHLKFELLPKNNSIILTTEKDFVKLRGFDEVIKGKYPWFFLPIDIEIDREFEFNQLLINYVGTI